jgi:hypothetical protein
MQESHLLATCSCRKLLAMADWLKTLGTSSDPLKDAWEDSHHPGFGIEYVTSRRRIRQMQPGDGIALYAARWQVVFAWGEVTSVPYEQQDDPEWPWRVNIRLERSVPFLHDGLPLSQANTPKRNLMISVRSKSHFGLQPAEFKAIKAKL